MVGGYYQLQKVDLELGTTFLLLVVMAVLVVICSRIQQYWA